MFTGNVEDRSHRASQRKRRESEPRNDTEQEERRTQWESMHDSYLEQKTQGEAMGEREREKEIFAWWTMAITGGSRRRRRDGFGVIYHCVTSLSWQSSGHGRTWHARSHDGVTKGGAAPGVSVNVRLSVPYSVRFCVVVVVQPRFRAVGRRQEVPAKSQASGTMSFGIHTSAGRSRPTCCGSPSESRRG